MTERTYPDMRNRMRAASPSMPPVRLPDPAELDNVRQAQPRHGKGRRGGDPRAIDLLPTVPEPFSTVGYAELHGMDAWLDHLETIAVAMAQRRMSEDQRERLYGLLERIYTDARTRRRPRPVRS